jgi:AraC family transcriptional regulator
MAAAQDLFLGNNRVVREVSGTTIALTAYGAGAGFEEWHSHANHSISLLLSGTHHESLQGRQLKRTPGDLKFIPAGVMHRCEQYLPGTCKINLDLNGEALQKMEIREEQLTGLSGSSLSAKFTLLKLYHELVAQEVPEASTELLLFQLFNPAKPVKHKAAPPLWAERLKDLLHDEWDKNFYLDDLSARLGVHPVTISRYFPLYFATTLGNYMQQLKINKALTMIRATATPLTQIAYNCGFADQAHFTRTFKAITGYRPQEFRKA